LEDRFCPNCDVSDVNFFTLPTTVRVIGMLYSLLEELQALQKQTEEKKRKKKCSVGERGALARRNFRQKE